MRNFFPRRSSTKGRLGQTLTEYTLLAAAFIPLAYWFAQALLSMLYRIFQGLLWDLSGPGI